MPKIVKNLNEANEKGLLDIPKAPTQSDLGKIVADIKGIVEGVNQLRGLQQKKEPEQAPSTTPMTDFNQAKTEATNKVPIAVLKLDENKLTEFLDGVFKENELDEKMTIGEIKEKWEFLKEMVKPTLKTAINKIAKAEIEFK
jgi:hypothetical protein